MSRLKQGKIWAIDKNVIIDI